MSRKQTKIARDKRVSHIKAMIDGGDTRSFNAIDAEIELQNWTERQVPLPPGAGMVQNNRKRTNGRKVQVIHLKSGSTKQIRTNK